MRLLLSIGTNVTKRNKGKEIHSTESPEASTAVRSKMVKNWADVCSSDEEGDDSPEPLASASTEVVESGSGPPDDESRPEQQEQQPPRVYEYPTEPPFTAFVGNLAFSIATEDALTNAIRAVVASILQTDIKIVKGRVAVDPYNGDRPKGFGYLEVETVEDLQKLMELNSCDGVFVAGRRLRFDTTGTSNNNNNNLRRSGNNNHRHHQGNNNNNNNRSSFGNYGGGRGGDRSAEVDGNKFRQGRHVRKDHGDPPQRTDTTTNNVPEGPPKQRTSLVLKPRSKPVVDLDNSETTTNNNAPAGGGDQSNLGGSKSSIFGDAKARDEQGWQERRKSEKNATQNPAPADASANPPPNPQPEQHQQGGRGGRGRGANSSDRGGGRRSGRGESGGRNGGDEHGRGRGSDRSKVVVAVVKADDFNKVSSSSVTGKKSEKQKAAPVVVAAAAPVKEAEPEKKAAPAKPTNAFASLALDSDSD